MVTRRDYTAEAAEACKAVLIELVHLMGEFRDHMVVVGGWVPALLFPEAPEPYGGTLDIDLALDFRQIPEDSYRTILQSLSARGYRQDPAQPFRFYPGGPTALAEAFRPPLGNTAVREGLEKIRMEFLSVDDGGPKWVADFMDVQDAEERAITRRRA